MLLVGSLDDFEGPIAVTPQGAAELVSSVAAIGEDMAQPREAIADGLEHINGTVAVLNVGGVDEDEDQKAAGIGDDMPLAPLDLLACVVAPNPAGFCGFDRLTVDHTRTWAGLAPHLLAGGHHQQLVDRGEQAAVTPRIKIPLYSRERRKILGEHPPLASTRR